MRRTLKIQTAGWNFETWRTVKCEHIYLNEYAAAPSLYAGLHSYFTFYNDECPHQSLDYRVPAEVHYGAF
jgi:putative transposase